MKTTITYTGTVQNRMFKAFQDAVWYLGNHKRYELCISAIRYECDTMRQNRMVLSFAGLQGAPASALIAYANRHKGCLKDWSAWFKNRVGTEFDEKRTFYQID